MTHRFDAGLLEVAAFAAVLAVFQEIRILIQVPPQTLHVGLGLLAGRGKPNSKHGWKLLKKAMGEVWPIERLVCCNASQVL